MGKSNQDKDALRQIKRVLAAALELPAGEQAAYVAGQGALSEEVRQEVFRLLEAQYAMPAPLEAGTLAAALQGDRREECPEPGEVLGERYRVERVLAEGGSSQVVEATDMRLAAARVAIKILQAGTAGRDAVLREIRAIAQVSHPGVCGLVDEGVWRERYPYVVQQFRAGENLRQRLAGGATGGADGADDLPAVGGRAADVS
ncbi:MAG: hypothetical protein NTX13_06890 [Acidobacteria bacterium]|nr:hypothetical protein [Acidobacteriota bacterium]